MAVVSVYCDGDKGCQACLSVCPYHKITLTEENKAMITDDTACSMCHDHYGGSIPCRQTCERKEYYPGRANEQAIYKNDC